MMNDNIRLSLSSIWLWEVENSVHFSLIIKCSVKSEYKSVHFYESCCDVPWHETVKIMSDELGVCPCISRATSLFLNAHPAALHLTPDKQQPSTAHHRWQIHAYGLELLMMGIEVPETCWAYHKCNKEYSDIKLVFLLHAYVLQILMFCWLCILA